ncbi:MAG: nucleoside-triphosphatase [Candidatus Krumholzibacteriia bacterium]
MARTIRHVLLTGRPGCGKTTVVRRVIEQLGRLRLAGFYTREVRQDGGRVGFEAVGLGGGCAMLAHRDFASRLRVGRYGVQLEAFDRLIRSELDRPPGDADLFIVDEIGKMECCGDVFLHAVRRLLDGPVPILATVASRGAGLIAEVKARPDAELLVVSAENRDRLPGELAGRFRRRSERSQKSHG